MHFGPDGKLYVAVGENATPSNAQSLEHRAGQDAALQRRRIDPGGQPVPRAAPRASTRRSGRSDCATRSASRSTRTAAGCSSTTWGRARGRRSTSGGRAPTTDGRPTKGATSTAGVRFTAVFLRALEQQLARHRHRHRRRGVLSASHDDVPRRAGWGTTSSATMAGVGEPAGYREWQRGRMPLRGWAR